MPISNCRCLITGITLPASVFACDKKQRYTLRYTGGMVPDVYHILIKGKGVFSNVSSATAKAKLRLLYECAPIALLVEAAGGARYTPRIVLLLVVVVVVVVALVVVAVLWWWC